MPAGPAGGVGVTDVEWLRVWPLLALGGLGKTPIAPSVGDAALAGFDGCVGEWRSAVVLGERRSGSAMPADDRDDSIGGGGGLGEPLARGEGAQLLLVGDGGLGDGVLRAGRLAVEADVDGRLRTAPSVYGVDWIAMIVWSPCAPWRKRTAAQHQLGQVWCTPWVFRQRDAHV